MSEPPVPARRPPEPMTAASRNVHSRLLIAALSIWIVFLGFEMAIRIWDLYRHFPPVDLPSHFLSGMAVTALAYWALVRRGIRRPKVWAIGISILVALLWEVVEALQERFFPDESAPWLVDVFFWDGATDILAGAAGAFLTFPILRLLRRAFKIFAPLDV